MNASLVIAAVLTLGTGVAHSVLGERYIVRRLLRRDNIPHLFGGDAFTKRTIRLAWHATTIAWWGAAALLFALARGPLDGGGRMAVLALALTFGVTSLATLAGSRGRHLAWPVFAAIAGLAWSAAG